MSKRAGKHAHANGGALMDRPVFSQGEVDDAVAKVKARHPELTQAHIDQGLAKVLNAKAKNASVRLAKLQPKIDAPVTEPRVVAAVAEAIKQTSKPKAKSKSAPTMAPALDYNGMIASSYYRRPGSNPMVGANGSFGALVQTPEMRGTMKGRWCKHQHASSVEAVECAKATIAGA